MEYRVDLSPRALADIDGIVGHIYQNSPVNAGRFRQRLFTKIGKLSAFPRGYSRAPDDAHARSRSGKRSWVAIAFCSPSGTKTRWFTC
jgi:plasmid stabilization system protein ParE